MSNMRISGMVSGMDTDTMVQSMMKVERLKVSRFEQNKQIALWRQEAFNNTNKMFANFILNSKKDMGLKTTTSTGMSLDKSYASLDYVKKATSSNETAATVSSTSKAMNGSYSLEVVELAKGASLTSGKVGKEDTFGTELNIKLTADGKEIEVKNTTGITMKDIAKAINDSKQGVNAFFEVDSLGQGALILQTSGTGENAKINLTATGSEKDKFTTAVGTLSAQGSYAQVKFNGVDMSYESNKFTINGVYVEAKAKGVTTINVSTNVDGIMEKVKKLVEDYNALIDNASKLLGEKKYPSYKPLSSEERNGMKENDVKLWDEKAKSGLLNSDETISRTLQTMRNDLYKTLEGVTGFNHITQIGISTEAYARGAAGGKLQIDEDKLRDAIMKDPEGVMELLFKDGKFKEDGKEDIIKPGNSTKGIFTRIYDDLIDGMKSIIEKSGTGGNSDLYRNVKSNILIDFVTTKSSISDIDKSITEMNKQIDNLNILFARKEDSYYAKFTQMEKYMQQMSGQSSWLSQQFMR